MQTESKFSRQQPIERVEWIDRTRLTPNDYNPNHQAPPEASLLETSILTDGWTQPIVVFDVEGRLVIVDGEHRWITSARPDVFAITGGLVPIVRVAATREGLMASTVRHNRARGEHSIMPMADIVNALLARHDHAEVATMLGMEQEEIDRLSESASSPARVSRTHTEFTEAWEPTLERPQVSDIEKRASVFGRTGTITKNKGKKR